MLEVQRELQQQVSMVGRWPQGALRVGLCMQALVLLQAQGVVDMWSAVLCKMFRAGLTPVGEVFLLQAQHPSQPSDPGRSALARLGRLFFRRLCVRS